MAPVGNLYRLVWGGRLYGTEGWSCSMHIHNPDDVNTPAADFRPALEAWVEAPLNGVSAAAKLDFIKYNKIVPTTGRYALQVTNSIEQNDMAVGVNGNGIPQVAVVVSLRTVLARGRAHAGRIYLPAGSLAVDSSGRLSTAIAQAISDANAALIAALNAVVPNAAGGVVVFSKVGQIVEPVVSVRVGRVLDTMRSRRTSLAEEPVTTAVTP